MAEKPSPHPVILVVDDVQDVRLSVRQLLEDEFTVLEAANSREALELVQRQKVDAVLTDLYMPGDIDGIALIGLIRQMPRPPPALIAMSGAHLAYRSSLQAALHLGADAALTKPFKSDELIGTIRRLLPAAPAVL